MMSEVSDFCTRLTGITPDMVADAAPLADALQSLRDQFRCDERLFASWGDYDRNQFMRNCRTLQSEIPLRPNASECEELVLRGLRAIVRIGH